MNAAAAVEAHYSTGLTRENIERALVAAGRDPALLEPADLAPLEDFHTMGRLATAALAALASIGPQDAVLDAGTGIGGAARFLAAQVGCRVAAVDLTAEYCEAAAWLNRIVGLDSLIDVTRADVLSLPFADASFDVVLSQHVQMNVADKAGLYREARRVLRPGGRLALWDVTAGPEQPIEFPVPWAVEPAVSHLVTPERLRAITARGGLRRHVLERHDRDRDLGHGRSPGRAARPARTSGLRARPAGQGGQSRPEHARGQDPSRAGRARGPLTGWPNESPSSAQSPQHG